MNEGEKSKISSACAISESTTSRKRRRNKTIRERKKFISPVPPRNGTVRPLCSCVLRLHALCCLGRSAIRHHDDDHEHNAIHARKLFLVSIQHLRAAVARQLADRALRDVAPLMTEDLILASKKKSELSRQPQSNEWRGVTRARARGPLFVRKKKSKKKSHAHQPCREKSNGRVLSSRDRP